MSCLFRSLSYFISNIETEELRYIITDYISRDPILINTYSVVVAFKCPTCKKVINYRPRIDCFPVLCPGCKKLIPRVDLMVKKEDDERFYYHILS